MAQTGNSFNSGACTEEVFDIKGLILKYIDIVPGIRYRELLRLTGLAKGTLEYNLKTLERTHRIKVFRQDGRRVGYYPIDFRSDEYQILEHTKNKVARKIALFILDNALCTFDRILENIIYFIVAPQEII
jgi:predicted transcriptional regulator